MGFFSWNCKRCEHPLLSVYSASSINDWMIEAVALVPGGGMYVGSYDGYGRIDGADLPLVIGAQEPQVYHRACWELEGKPTEYTAGSENAADQGFFFDHEHDVPDPREGMT